MEISQISKNRTIIIQIGKNYWDLEKYFFVKVIAWSMDPESVSLTENAVALLIDYNRVTTFVL